MGESDEHDGPHPKKWQNSLRQASMRVLEGARRRNPKVQPANGRKPAMLTSKSQRIELEKQSLWTQLKNNISPIEFISNSLHSWVKGKKQDEAEVGLGPTTVHRSTFHFVVCKAVESHAFNFAIISTIVVNMITIALETLQAYQNKKAERTFQTLSTIYLSIYSVEFLFKIYAEPINYWKNNYNRMDFSVLAISYVTDVILEQDNQNVDVSFLKLFRALRALRALRSISFVRPLQVLVSALLKTMSSIVYLVALLLLLMFVWAMIGHYVFGRGPDAIEDEWGTIQFSMYQLWVLVTLDSWTDIQNRLLEREFSLAVVSAYIVPWIFVGNFIFTNLFIGVVVQNLEEAQSEEKAIREMKRNEMFRRKKNFIIEKQKRDLEQLMKSQEKHGKMSLDDFLKTLAGTLNHEDVAPIKTLCCSKLWFETYLESMTFYDKSRLRVQRLHMDTAKKLHDVVERRMEEMRSAADYTALETIVETDKPQHIPTPGDCSRPPSSRNLFLSRNMGP